MDTYLAIASKRDKDRYGDRPIPAELLDRILDAGRLAGSSKNRQPWRFLVVETPERRERLAQALYAPHNVRAAAAVIAVVGKGFDLGRATQNLMLGAWNEGVASSPNGIADRAAAAAALGVDDPEEVGIVVTLGYPAKPRDPESRSAADWSARANRKPLAEVVTRL